jgi:hypothetical protein
MLPVHAGCVALAQHYWNFLARQQRLRLLQARRTKYLALG